MPWASITLDLIREKRREIYGVSGDNNGLGKMRERFRLKHDIDPDNDPNGSNKTFTEKTYPLFAITQRIRQEIKHSLETQIEQERNGLKEHITKL